MNSTMVRLGVLPMLLAALVLGAGCIERYLFLSATDLDIAPNPAAPGDSVTFAIRLTVIPGQPYSVVAIIDAQEHVSVPGSEAVDGPFVIELGDAADLIARYGVGAHVGYVEVRLTEKNRISRSGEVGFDLQTAVPLSVPAR